MSTENGKNRLPLVTFVISVGTMLITYAITVTMIYARLDKEQALQRQQIEQLQRQLQGPQVTRQDIDALWRAWTETKADVDYLNRSLEPEVPRRRR